jgi:three-Cys-motif partner protein
MPRVVGDWTRDKLKILTDYLPAYLTATQRAMERIYIDAFAGPGFNRLRRGEVINGSPLIGLDAVGSRGTRFDRLYFIENDTSAVQELTEVVADHPFSSRVQILPGDVNDELPRLIKKLPKRSPTFVFLDPEGIDPRWSTIQAIADWQTELLVNFPLGMAINRNPDSTKVDDYFGTEEWRLLWSQSHSFKASSLLALYKRRLAELGYRFQVDDARLIRDSGGRRLYYLIFVSKVGVARRIMTSVFRQPDAAGQERLL